MSELQSFGQRVRDIWKRLQKPTALLLVLAATLFRYFDLAIAKEAAIAATLLIALSILFELHGAVSAAPNVFFDKYQLALLDFQKRMEAASSRDNDISIRWFGVTMQHGAIDIPMVLRDLPRRGGKIHLSAVMLDPKWRSLNSLNTAWPKQTAVGSEMLDKYMREQIATHAIESAELFVYDHMPNLHGFSLNDRYFYISMCVWDERQMAIVGSGFEFVESGTDRASDAKIKLFTSWFDHCRIRAIYRTHELNSVSE